MIKNITVIAIMLIPSIFFGMAGKTTEMGLAIISSSITCAFIHIDKIQKFKGAGFEAEMKKVVDEAYVTINALREFSIPLIKATMNSLNYGNRFGGLNIKERVLMKEQIENMVHNFNLTNDEIENTFEDFRHLHLYDHFQEFKDSILKNNNQNKSLREKLESISRMEKDYPTKEFIDKILRDENIDISQEQEQKLKSYLFYLENNKLYSYE